MRIGSNGLKSNIINHFKAQPKVPKFLYALRRSIYISIKIPKGIVDNNLPISNGRCFPDRDYIERYRVVLSRLFLSMKATNLQAVILLYEALLE